MYWEWINFQINKGCVIFGNQEYSEQRVPPTFTVPSRMSFQSRNWNGIFWFVRAGPKERTGSQNIFSPGCKLAKKNKCLNAKEQPPRAFDACEKQSKGAKTALIILDSIRRNINHDPSANRKRKHKRERKQSQKEEVALLWSIVRTFTNKVSNSPMSSFEFFTLYLQSRNTLTSKNKRKFEYVCLRKNKIFLV